MHFCRVASSVNVESHFWKLLVIKIYYWCIVCILGGNRTGKVFKIVDMWLWFAISKNFLVWSSKLIRKLNVKFPSFWAAKFRREKGDGSHHEVSERQGTCFAGSWVTYLLLVNDFWSINNYFCRIFFEEICRNARKYTDVSLVKYRKKLCYLWYVAHDLGICRSWP